MTQMEGSTLPEPTYELLAQLLRQRLRKFRSLFLKVIIGDDVETVHDVRVWSRRLQQTISGLFPKPQPRKVKRVQKRLRRVRRALGEWRNYDVLLELVAREQKTRQSQDERHAWDLLQRYLREMRAHQVLRARERLLGDNMEDLPRRVQKLLDRSAGKQNSEELIAPLRASIETAWTRWQSALAHAQGTHEADDIHTFRIATKRLRYRIELMHDLGDERTRPLLDDLKDLQEKLGIWHDRQSLYQVMAEALARPRFLLREPGAARTLLAEFEEDRLRQSTVVDEIFRLASEWPWQKQLEAPEPR